MDLDLTRIKYTKIGKEESFCSHFLIFLIFFEISIYINVSKAQCICCCGYIFMYFDISSVLSALETLAGLTSGS